MYTELVSDLSDEKKEKWNSYIENLDKELLEYTEQLKKNTENFENNLNM